MLLSCWQCRGVDVGLSVVGVDVSVDVGRTQMAHCSLVWALKLLEVPWALTLAWLLLGWTSVWMSV